jgi:hypothetical protein
MSLKSIEEEVLADLKGAADEVGAWLETTFKGAVKAEVAVALPIFSAAAGSLAVDLATNAGNPKAFAATAAKILADGGAQLETQSIQATGASVLAAFSSAVTAHMAAVPLGGSPTPPLPATPAATPAASS